MRTAAATVLRAGDAGPLQEGGARWGARRGAARGRPRELYVFEQPISVDDPDATHFEPDLTVVRREFAKVENGDVPLLAVEVRSPSTAGHDAVLKRREYARLGIGAYWLLDVDVPSLRVLELRGGEYVETAYGASATPVVAERPFPVTVVPALLFAL